MDSAPPAIEVEFRNVTLRVRRNASEAQEILSSLTLSVRRGECFVLLGRSGSGKTTALKLVNRLVDPTEGNVFVEGRSTRDWDPIRLRRRTGYIIQETGLLPHFTIAQNIGLVPQLEGWPGERIRARVDELLLLVGLEPSLFRERLPRELSGGQRQRVGVARALAADPPLLLADEPFGALDPITRAELQREFASLQRRLGKTVLFVTHDLREALLLGMRIGLLEAGRLSGVYSPHEFLRTQDSLPASYRSAFDWKNDGSKGAAE